MSQYLRDSCTGGHTKTCHSISGTVVLVVTLRHVTGGEVCKNFMSVELHIDWLAARKFSLANFARKFHSKIDVSGIAALYMILYMYGLYMILYMYGLYILYMYGLYILYMYGLYMIFVHVWFIHDIVHV